jgi:hypothetical protein
MYLAYGWPRVLQAESCDGAERDARSCQIVQILSDESLIVVVTRGGVQVWSGGQQRVLLSRRNRSTGDIRTEGSYYRACWSPSRRMLAVVVSDIESSST